MIIRIEKGGPAKEDNCQKGFIGRCVPEIMLAERENLSHNILRTNEMNYYILHAGLRCLSSAFSFFHRRWWYRQAFLERAFGLEAFI